MEVMVPTKELHFDSTTSTPFVSAPTSPNRFGIDRFDYCFHYTTAPTSPARSASVVPFNWEEETPGTPKSRKPPAEDDDGDDNYNDEYVFEFSGQLEKGVLPAADELFKEGKIRPLKPPPRLYNLNGVYDKNNNTASSPRSPRSSSKGRVWSPHQKKKSDDGGIDPFAAAIVEATRERGRERSAISSPSMTLSSRRNESRSLSPMRGELRGSLMQFPASSPSQASTTTAASSVRGGKSSSKKWRLRDLLLFRSASEGRATGNTSKDPLRKFSISSTTGSSSLIGGEESRNSSFRSTDSVGSSMRRGNMSPHEMHYTSNRAAAEERKRRTALPFGSHGLFGCLRFNPAVQSVAREFHGRQL